MAEAPSPKSGKWSPHLPASPESKKYEAGIVKSGPTQLSDGAISESETGTAPDR